VIGVLRRTKKALLILLVLVVVGGIGAVYLAGQSRWARAQLRAVIAEQLAQRTGREVQVGAVEGNLLSGVVINDLAIAAGEHLADGVVLAAERIRVDYDLFAIIRGRPPLACIPRVEIDRAYADVARDEQGIINLTQIFLPPEPPRVIPPEERFRGQVVITSSVLDLHDEAAPTHDGRPLELRLTDVSGEVLISQYGPLYVHLEAGSTNQRFAAAELDVRADTATNTFAVDGKLRGVDAPWWYEQFVRSPGFDLTGGTIDGRFTVWWGIDPESSRGLDYFASATVKDATARVAALRGPVRFDARASVTPAGANIQTLSGTWEGASVQATGSLFDWSDLTVDLTARVSNLAPESVLELLPPNSHQAVNLLGDAGRLNADLQVIGQLADPSVELAVRSRGMTNLVIQDDFPVAVSGLQVQASIPSVASPAIAAQVSAAQLSPAPWTIPDESADGSTQHTVHISDLQNVELNLAYAGAMPVLETAVQVRRATVDDLPLDNLQGRLQMAGNTVRLSNLQAEVAGGKVIGQALAVWDEDDHPQIYFDLAGRDLQLASLQQIPGLDPGDLSGQANLLLAGEVRGGKPHIIGRTRVGDLCFRDVTVQQVTGLWELREANLHLRLVRVSDPKGQVWVQGAVSREQKMDLKVSAAELNLADWGRQLGRPGLSGVAFVRADVTGTMEDLIGNAELVAFGAGSQQFATDALCVRATVEQSAVVLDELLVSRGPAMIAGSGRLGGLSPQAQQMPVAADLKVVGFGLQEISDHLGLDPPLSGVSEVGVTVSGTMQRPEITAQLAIPYGYYGPYPITDMELTVAADEDRLRIQEGNLKLAGAAISLEGYLGRWQQLVAGQYTQPDFTLQFSAENIDLQSIISPEETNVEIAGRVDLPEAVIRSSPQGIVGQAHLLVPRLVIGDQQVSAIDTMIIVEQGKVSLQDTTLQVAGGQVRAGGDYQWEQKQGRAYVELSGGHISRILRVAAPVSKLVGGASGSSEIAKRLRGLALRALGDTDLAVALEGSAEQMTAYLQAELTELSFDRKALPDVSGECTVQIADGQLVAVHDILADITQGEGLLTVEGNIDPDGELSLLADGTNFNIALWRQWLPEEISMGGTIGVITVAASGPTRRPSFRGSVFVDSPTFEGIKFDQANIPVLSLDETGLDIDMLLLKRGEQEIVLRGKLPVRWKPLGLDPEGHIELVGKLENTDLGFFPALLDEFVRARAEKEPDQTLWGQLRARGRVDSEINISGRLDDPAIEGYLRVSEGKIAPPGWHTGFEDFNANITLDRRDGHNVIDISSAQVRLDNTEAKLGGSVALTQLTSFWHNQFDLALQISSPQQTLLGESIIRELVGRITMKTQPDRSQLVTIEKLAGNLGEGAVRLAGHTRIDKFDYVQLANNEVDLEIELVGATVNYAPVFKGQLDGMITVSNPAKGQPAIAMGRIVPSQARVAPPAGGGGGGPTYSWGPQRPAPQFDIEVVLGENVVLKTPGLTAPLQANTTVAHLTGSPQRPLITGLVEFTPGRASVPTGLVHIAEMGVQYHYGPKPGEYREPMELALSGRIWGEARQLIPSAMVDGRQIDQLTIFINIDGNLPNNINLTLSSRPPLSENQLYQIIGTGPLGLVTGEGGGSLTDMFSQQFTGLLAAGFRTAVFRPIEEQIKQALGLDQFTVMFGFDQPIDVHIGKYVMEDLLVNYRHTVVSETEDKWDLGLSYELPRKFRVSFTTDEKSDVQFRISYTRSF